MSEWFCLSFSYSCCCRGVWWMRNICAWHIFDLINFVSGELSFRKNSKSLFLIRLTMRMSWSPRKNSILPLFYPQSRFNDPKHIKYLNECRESTFALTNIKFGAWEWHESASKCEIEAQWKLRTKMFSLGKVSHLKETPFFKRNNASNIISDFIMKNFHFSIFSLCCDVAVKCEKLLTQKKWKRRRKDQTKWVPVFFKFDIKNVLKAARVRVPTFTAIVFIKHPPLQHIFWMETGKQFPLERARTEPR